MTNQIVVRVVLAPVFHTDSAVFAQWEYLKYEQTKFPCTEFINIQVKAYEQEMAFRGNTLDMFIQKEMEKLR